MSFGDGLTPKGSPCSVCSYLDTLDDDARAKVEAFFADRDSYSHAALADEMAREQWACTESSVRRHRRNHMGQTSDLR